MKHYHIPTRNDGPTRCKRTCPGGNPCCCRAHDSAGKPLNHTLHICTNPHCICHSAQRYLDAKRER